MSDQAPRSVRHYNRAPIAQATIDFSIEAIDSEKADALIDRVLTMLNDDYPDAIRSIGEGEPEESVKARSSSDGLRIIDPRADGFSFSRLAPYDCWETFSEEARRTWTIYAQIVEPDALTALTVRYYNKLKVPYGFPLHKFFNVYPSHPDRDVLFNKLLMFYEIDTANPPGTCATVMVPGERADESHFYMSLDNIFHFHVTTEAAVWDSFTAIRTLKNHIFNSQLTEDFKETIA